MTLEKSVTRLLVECLGLSKGESCLVVCDLSRKDLGRAVYDGARRLTTAVRLTIVDHPTPTGWQDHTLLELEKEMISHDVILLLTGRSLSHTDARRRAVAKGARLVSMPGVTEDILLRATHINYPEVSKRSKGLKNIFTAGETVHVCTEAGTDVTFSIRGMEGHSEDGLYNRPGRWGNLPAGEACVGPCEGTAEGVIIVDWSMSGLGCLHEPLVITVDHGLAVKISGKQADILFGRLNPFGLAAFTISEFGLGTNDQAELSGIVLEDEKVLGTAHFALGNNITFGGSVDVPIHLDGVLRYPNVTVDGKPVVEKGSLLV